MAKKHNVRCRNSACRHRRLSSVHPDEAKKVVKCPACGESRGWRVEWNGPERRKMCHCHSVVNLETGRTYPHRLGQHPYCDHHPLGALNQAKRAGVTDPGDLIEATIHSAGRVMKQDEECPF